MSNKISSKRECNYDLLRIVATVAVVFLHVSAIYKSAITDSASAILIDDSDYLGILALNTLPRFAVPCFLFLTGALVIGNDANSDFSYFYKKSFYKIGVPAIVFTVLYLLYSFALDVPEILRGGVQLLLHLQSSYLMI